jgi:uncharacterized protein (TIGR02996 family)
MAAVATDPGLQGFFAAVREDPADTATLLVFADCLDERGDPRACWLRLAAQLFTLQPVPTRRRSIGGLFRRLHRGPAGRVWCGLAAVALAEGTLDQLLTQLLTLSGRLELVLDRLAGAADSVKAAP